MSFVLSALVFGLAAIDRVHAQGAGSPQYNYIYQKPLPIPAVAEPSFTINHNGTIVDYFHLEIKDFQRQVYPNLGPARLTGYNGTAPGPTFRVQKGHESIVRYVNNGRETASVHLHGSYTHSVWDGWAADELKTGEWKDYYYPNSESARSMWYHDHAEGHTAENAYYGQAGAWIVYDPEEDSLGLPSGKYDVPLALTDKKYEQNGDLSPPGNNPMNFFGDIIQVNEQPWPFFAVEPRKYRLRIFDMALSRVFTLNFKDHQNNKIDFAVIASDSGLFRQTVWTKDVTISPGERYEIVIDFSPYAGKQILLGNSFATSIIPRFDNTDKVMQFNVGSDVTDQSNNGIPGALAKNVQHLTTSTSGKVDKTFNFQLGGDSFWTINGVDFNNVNNRVLARPIQGTVELWELRHAGGPAAHPVHVHLVNLQVVSRSGGTRGILPYEVAGLKDVVLLEPGETVRVLAQYGPWNGMYMFHCHNMIHEDNTMLAVFNVTLLEELGYKYPNSTDYGNPEDPRFAPKASAAADFEPAAVTAAVKSLAEMQPYASASQILAEQNAYWSTAPYSGETGTGPSATAPASSAGAFFPVFGVTSAAIPEFSLPPAPTGIADFIRKGLQPRDRVWQTVATPTPSP